MSRNRKYIEQFDRNAGKPSDFDSLFDFEDKKLIAKRRIKMKSSKSYAAAMCSAAAVIGIAAFAALAYINEKGIASDSVLSKSEGMTPSSEFTESLEGESAISLSSLMGHFDYNASGDLSGSISQTERTLMAGEMLSDDFRAVIRFSVVSKSYDASWGAVLYSVRPLEYYADNELFEFIKNNTDRLIKFSCSAYNDVEELQAGGEYIMTFGKTGELFEDGENDEFSIDSVGVDNFARRTDKGWLIYSSENSRSPLFEALSSDTERVFDDIGGTDCYSLEPSDEKLEEKLRAYLEDISDVTFYHGVIDDGEGVSKGGYYNLNSILPKAQFEKVSYGIDTDGSSDRTLLVLDNEKYFSLMPYLSGAVAFAGENERGEQCTVLDIAYYGEPETESYAKTVLISGFETLNVAMGDALDEQTVIGECNANPIYMQFIDNNGLPMEIELEDSIEETTVIPVNE